MIKYYFSNNNTIRNIQILFLVNATIWIFLAISYLLLGNMEKYFLIAILLLLEAIISKIIGYGIKLQKKWIYYITLFYIITNIILTITDQIGFYDIFILIVFSIILINLFINRKLLTNNS